MIHLELAEVAHERFGAGIRYNMLVMTLNAHFDGQWHGANSAEEVGGLISALIAAPMPERPSRFMDALLCFAGEPFCHKFRTTPKGVKGHLLVAVNKVSGYGALMWYWGGSDPVWVSENPQPPDFDPRVVADPGGVLFHNPRSTLPIGKFREMVEEFCYSGTGDRPTGVRWAYSDVCGRRMDEGYYDRVEIVTDRFADSGQCRGAIGHVIAVPSGKSAWVKVVNPDGLTGAEIIAQPEDLRLLTRGTAGIWPFLPAEIRDGSSLRADGVGERAPRVRGDAQDGAMAVVGGVADEHGVGGRDLDAVAASLVAI